MLRNPLSASLVCAAFLAAGARAQNERFIISNISGTNGSYTDSLTLWTTGGQRPLVSEANVRGATNSPRSPRVRVIGGKTYVYWVNTFRSDAFHRATDRNGNGVMDSSEIEEIFKPGGNVSSGAFDERGGTFAAGFGIFNSATAGVYSLKDLNGDGDFKDAGEAKQLVKGPTHTVGATTYSSDDVREIVLLNNGDILWHEDDAGVWFRTTAAGQTSVWLVYKTPRVVSGTPPALNSDWANSRLPAIGTQRLDRATYDPATNTVYLTVCFVKSLAIVFSAKDGNNDGDVQDPGEVRIHFDGTKQNPPFGPMDDIEWMAGSLYGSYEINPGTDNGSQFWKLTGTTLLKIGRTAPTDDPTALGVTVAPAGTFGSSCVVAAITNDKDPVSSAAGQVQINVKDAASVNGSRAFGGLSLTGDGALPLFGCTWGITIDALTAAGLEIFQTPPIAGGKASFPPLQYPAGLPKGAKIYFMAFFVDFTKASFTGITGTGLMTVQ